MNNTFEGTGVLYRATLKQSLRSILPWVLAIVILSLTSYLAYARVFPGIEDQQKLNMTVQSNPAFNLIFGKADNLLSAEGFTAWRSVVLGSFMASMMSILLITKHTRAKEDSGEEELLASSVVGRYTLTTVALLVAITASLFAAIAIAAPLIAVGADREFSVFLGLTIAMSGVVFAAIALLAAQLVSYSRTVTSLSVSILAVAYLLRGMADTVDSASWLSWLSPLGWAQRTNIATSSSVLPLFSLLALTVVVASAAYGLKSRRDFGQGIRPDTPRNDRAGKSGSVGWLVFKLQKGTIIGWGVAFLFLGTAFGYMLDAVGGSFSANEGISSLVGADGATGSNFTFQFATTLITIIGIIAATYGAQLINRLYIEENSQRTDPLLAGSLKRTKLFSAFVKLAIIGPVSAMLVSGLLFVAIAYLNGIDVGLVDMLYQALLTTPAVLLLVSLAIATIGLYPKLRGLAWIGISVSFGLTLLGPILQLNKNLLAISPFWHVGNASLASLSITSTVVLLAIATALIMIGFVGYHRRDIARV